MADVTKVDEGLYVVRHHDTPKSIASLLYQNPLHYQTLLKNNPDDPFNEGEHIKVPNKKGRVTIWQEGETIEQLLKRMFPNQPVHIFRQLFDKWNADGEIEPGSVVFVPER